MKPQLFLFLSSILTHQKPFFFFFFLAQHISIYIYIPWHTLITADLFDDAFPRSTKSDTWVERWWKRRRALASFFECIDRALRSRLFSGFFLPLFFENNCYTTPSRFLCTCVLMSCAHSVGILTSIRNLIKDRCDCPGNGHHHENRLVTRIINIYSGNVMKKKIKNIYFLREELNADPAPARSLQ